MKLTPEHLTSLLTQYSENPLYGATERDALKQAAELIGELEKGKARIDWFDNSEPPFVICGNNKLFTVRGWSSAGEGKNIRAAIDVAMESEK